MSRREYSVEEISRVVAGDYSFVDDADTERVLKLAKDMALVRERMTRVDYALGPSWAEFDAAVAELLKRVHTSFVKRREAKWQDRYNHIVGDFGQWCSVNLQRPP